MHAGPRGSKWPRYPAVPQAAGSPHHLISPNRTSEKGKVRQEHVNPVPDIKSPSVPCRQNRLITLHQRSSNPLRFQSSRAQPRKEVLALFLEQGSVTASDMEMVAPHGNAWKLGLQTTA